MIAKKHLKSDEIVNDFLPSDFHFMVSMHFVQ